MSESTLMDVPTGIVTFHMDMNEPRVPGKTPFIVCLYVYSVEETLCCNLHLFTQRNKMFNGCQLAILKTNC